jgi:hypothetical protein
MLEVAMKKIILLVIGVMLVSAPVFSYDINDAVGDRLGQWKFEVYGIDVSTSGTNLVYDIFTNYPINSTVTVGTWKTFTGDLALSVTDNYDWSYGVALTDHDGLAKGTVYSNAAWHISNEYEPINDGYNYTYNENQIVTLRSGSVFGVGSVTSSTIDTLGAPNGPDYKITVTIPNLSGYVPDFKHTYWASATCANDFVGAPEPVSTVLFITGGSVLLIRRMRKARKS